MNELQTVMKQVGTPTLKAIAMVFEIAPPRIYSVAKQPKEGEVYDAKVYNWDAIERFVQRRLDPDKGLATFEDVIRRALEIDEELKKNDGRRREAGATKGRIEVDGKMIERRKFTNFEMSEGKLFCLKKDPRVFKAVYQTESHTVLVPVSDYEGNVASQEVIVISNGRLNAKGIGPGAIDEAIQKRFNGEYAVPADPDAPSEATEAAEDVEKQEG